MKRVEIAEAVNSKFPEWVVFVIAAGADGRANLMPAGWVAFASGNPPMATVAVSPRRHTHRLIEESGQFILAWAGRGQEELVRLAGSTSGRDIDKLARFALKTSPPVAVKAPLIEGCAMALECKLAGQMVVGDHTVFAGRILAAHLADPPIDKIVNFGQDRFAAATVKNK